MPKKKARIGGRYVLGKKLGEGGFSVVRLATDFGTVSNSNDGNALGENGDVSDNDNDKESKKSVAVKVMDAKHVRRHFAAVRREIEILRNLRHVNIVQLLDVVQTKSHVYVVMELVSGGELYEVLAEEQRLDEDRARDYFQQLIRGVDYCHRAGICHRDLKPENLLLSADRTVLKIVDFGFSTLHHKEGHEGSNVLFAACGTPHYAAPELGLAGYVGDAADIWSCGIILYVLVAGFVPFDGSTEGDIREQVRSGKLRFPRWFTADLRALLRKIIVVNPEDRATIDIIKQDEWFASSPFIDDNPPHKPSLRELDALTEMPTEEEEDDPESEFHVHIDGLRITNAFELIALSGVFDLSPAFRGEADVVAEGRVRRNTSFTSRRSPKRILSVLEDALEEMPVGFRIEERTYRIRVQAALAHGQLMKCIIVIYALAARLYVVEFKKKQGDFLDFHRFFKELRARCRDLIDDEDKSMADSSSDEEDPFVDLSSSFKELRLETARSLPASPKRATKFIA